MRGLIFKICQGKRVYDIGKRRGGLCTPCDLRGIHTIYNVIAISNDLADCEHNVIPRGRRSSLKVENKVEIKETFVRLVWSDRRSDRKEMNAEKMFSRLLQNTCIISKFKVLKKSLTFFLLLRSYIYKSIYIHFFVRDVGCSENIDALIR